MKYHLLIQKLREFIPKQLINNKCQRSNQIQSLQAVCIVSMIRMFIVGIETAAGTATLADFISKDELITIDTSYQESDSSARKRI